MAASADSKGIVSCLISQKTTGFKWEGLAAASERKGFRLSLVLNRFTKELTILSQLLSVVEREAKRG